MANYDFLLMTEHGNPIGVTCSGPVFVKQCFLFTKQGLANGKEDQYLRLRWSRATATNSLIIRENAVITLPADAVSVEVFFDGRRFSALATTNGKTENNKKVYFTEKVNLIISRTGKSSTSPDYIDYDY